MVMPLLPPELHRRVAQAGLLPGPGGEKPLWLLPLDPSVPRCLVLPSSAAHLAPELKEEAATPLEGPEARRCAWLVAGGGGAACV